MSNDLYRNKYRIPSARADWHNYNSGCFFITICTDKRAHFFGEITNNTMTLSEIGKFTESLLNELHMIYNDAEILSYVIMPNHIHLIISVEGNKDKISDANTDKDKNEKMQAIANKCGRMSHIISRFKSYITKYARDNDIYFMWQSRFYDRIIRDHSDFIITQHYIDNNISKWNEDDYYSPIY